MQEGQELSCLRKDSLRFEQAEQFWIHSCTSFLSDSHQAVNLIRLTIEWRLDVALELFSTLEARTLETKMSGFPFWVSNALIAFSEASVAEHQLKKVRERLFVLHRPAENDVLSQLMKQ